MTQVTVTGKFQTPANTAAAGYVMFTPSPAHITIAGSVIKLGPAIATLDNTGSFSLALQATDDPSINPTGWTYTVKEFINDTVPRVYSITVPVGTVGNLDLSNIAPVDSASGSVQFIPTAYTGVLPVVTVSGSLTATKHNPVDATAAGVTMTLPASPTVGQLISIEKTDATTNTVIVSGNIRGNPAGTLTLIWQRESMVLVAKADGSWWPIAGHKTKSSLDAAYQPLDSDLTAIAALTTTAFGRALLTQPDGPTTLTTLGGMAIPQVATFLSGSGNYTIPSGAKTLRVQALGGGGGGGSGRRGAAGTVRCGGGGGAGAFYVDAMLSVADVLVLYPTGVIPYFVASGGVGGVAVTTDDTNGNFGTGSGITTLFGTGGNLVTAGGGNAGLGGTATTGSGGQMTSTPGASGASATTTGGVGVSTNQANPLGAGGGASGGGIPTTNVPGAGMFTRTSGFAAQAASVGGVVDGAIPSGPGAMSVLLPGGGAPSGAASITTAAQTGANAQANSGAGGGGGGASLNGNNSGAGGNGGSGFIRITAM